MTYKTLKAPEARVLIGQMVAWDVDVHRQLGTYKTYFGTMEEVTGKNALISGDYKWLPKLYNLRAAMD